MYLKSTVLCSFADTIFFGTRDQLEFPEDQFRNHSCPTGYIQHNSYVNVILVLFSVLPTSMAVKFCILL